MRDFYRNPMFYYLLAPIVVAIWPLLVWGVYLPDAQKKVVDENDLCTKGSLCIAEILNYTSDEIEVPTRGEGFSFPSAVDRVSTFCNIRPDSRTYTAGSIIDAAGGKKRQNCQVKLKDVGIAQAANFLSQMQSMYINCKCDKIKLVLKKGTTNQWDADLDFWYTY